MLASSDMRGKVVVVTGASSGIGRAAALAFAAAGARVALVARSADPLEAAAREARERGGVATAVVADVTDRAQVASMVAAVVREFGRIDVLVNNAGIGAHGPFWGTPYPDFERILRVNFFGVAYCTAAVLPHMIAQRSGRIVNVSSMIGKRAYPGNAAYCASKFALEGFSEALRTEVRHHGIRVIQVCPGFTETGFFDHLLQTGGHRRPARRGMSAERVAALLLRAVERDRREIVISLRGKLLVLLDTFFPALLDRLLQARFQGRFADVPPRAVDPAPPT